MNTIISATLLLTMLTILPVKADGIIAVLKNPSSVERRDAKTGAYKGSLSVSKAIGVGCDGETIAVLLASGSVARYHAGTGAYQGTIQMSGKPTAVQVSGGMIVVTTERSWVRYNAKTGAYLGSSSR